MGKLIDKVHFAIAAQCLDFATTLNNATYLLGNAVNVKNYGRLTVVIMGGSSAGVTGAVTLRQAATAAGVVVGATIVPIEWVYVNTQTSVESDTWVKTAVTDDSITSIAGAHYLNYIIELETAVLTYEWVGLNIVAAGGAKYMSALYILSDPRYICAEDAPSCIV
jgi:hypothetical protein